MFRSYIHEQLTAASSSEQLLWPPVKIWAMIDLHNIISLSIVVVLGSVKAFACLGMKSHDVIQMIQQVDLAMVTHLGRVEEVVSYPL